MSLLREEGGTVSPLKKRRRAVGLIFVLTSVASIGGLVASTMIKSPAQLAAETRAPQPSVLTGEVVKKVLSTTVVMRGAFSGGRVVSFTPAAGTVSADGPAASALVVTGVKTRLGATVRPGEVLLEVSERPVYALPGAFPAYRDMIPGEAGRDIAQLQDALIALGFAPRDDHGHRDKTGYFGPGTQVAVTRFYARLGYSPPITDAAYTTTGTSSPASAGTSSSASGAATAGSSASATSSPSASASPQATGPLPMVPRSEVVFLPALPAKVATLSVHVGDVLSGANPAIGFGTGGLQLVGKLDPGSAPLVKPGTKVDVRSEATGFTASGSVASVGQAVTGADGTTYVPVVIARRGGWGRELAGQDVRITITTATSGSEVLAVPEQAITSAADGGTSVTVVDADQRQHVVPVTAGVSADGMVAVTPVGSAQLKVGDKVVTGE